MIRAHGEGTWNELGKQGDGMNQESKSVHDINQVEQALDPDFEM